MFGRVAKVVRRFNGISWRGKFSDRNFVCYSLLLGGAIIKNTSLLVGLTIIGRGLSAQPNVPPTINTTASTPSSVTPSSVTVAPPVNSSPAKSPTVVSKNPNANTKKFSFAVVTQKALELSKQKFDHEAQNADPSLESLTYDDYRKVRFHKHVNLLPDTNKFRIEAQSTGFLFKKYVNLHIIDEGKDNIVADASNVFDLSDLEVNKTSSDSIGSKLQVAGFRILYPLHPHARRDETLVFLGASYFRPLSANQQFGASGRGLAIDTASEKGEEFPFFREFWIQTLPKKPDSIMLYALMDSQSMTGAYSFLVRPGDRTIMEVEAHLFPRTAISKVGIAPLTSMFVFSEAPHDKFNDYRKEVHDSDGLLMLTGNNEWIWRPLQNPYQNGVRVTQYVDNNPQGFGLMQRDTDYNNYLDLEARYDRRPSLWVTPQGSWGKGSVELVEISTAEETVDNIVAYWVPHNKLPVGRASLFKYKVEASATYQRHHPLGKAVRLRIGHYHDPGKPLDQRSDDRIFSVDFTDGILSELLDEEVQGIVEARNGRVSDVRVQKDPIINGMRLWFRLSPDGEDVDLRISLHKGHLQLTETVVYLYLNK
jgi:glucans biosynthesis protein